MPVMKKNWPRFLEMSMAQTYLEGNSTCHASPRCTLWQVFAFYRGNSIFIPMKYTKLPISIQDQMATLRKRGLQFANEHKAAHYVSNISYHLDAYIFCKQYILNIISPQQSFKNKLVELMKGFPLLQEKEMGFPKDWKNEKIWQTANA